MKFMNKLQDKLKKAKKDNKGFSLVELIIVIAIMAILVGIVGTQVIPYINKSKEAKDQQILNSYSTAAVSAYSMIADEISTESGSLEVKVYGTNTDADALKLAPKIKSLAGYSSATDKMTSTTGKTATEITITFNFDDNKVTTVATGTTLKNVEATF